MRDSFHHGVRCLRCSSCLFVSVSSSDRSHLHVRPVQQRIPIQFTMAPPGGGSGGQAQQDDGAGTAFDDLQDDERQQNQNNDYDAKMDRLNQKLLGMGVTSGLGIQRQGAQGAAMDVEGGESAGPVSEVVATGGFASGRSGLSAGELTGGTDGTSGWYQDPNQDETYRDSYRGEGEDVGYEEEELGWFQAQNNYQSAHRSAAKNFVALVESIDELNLQKFTNDADLEVGSEHP